MLAPTALPVRYAADPLYPQVPEASTATTAPTAYAAFMWTPYPVTVNRTAADDNPMLMMSIAMKPVSLPPFPLEKIEEMTELMAGDGRLR